MGKVHAILCHAWSNTAFTKLAKMKVIWRFVNAQNVIRHRTQLGLFSLQKRFVKQFILVGCLEVIGVVK
jgi:hypothetical protein